MREILSLMRGALTLDQATFERLRDSRDAMRTGVLLALAIFLIAGSLQAAVNLVGALRPLAAPEAADMRRELMDALEPLLGTLPQGSPARDTLATFTRNLEIGLKLAAEVNALETPLPRGVSRTLPVLGGWLSQPLARLAAFLAYGAWVLLFAKLMGGNGGVDRFYGVAALYSVPNLLDFFAPIPAVGWLLALVGTVWGWAVYVRAVQVTQRLDLGRAVAASVLPIVALAALVALAMALLALVIFLVVLFSGVGA
ncbi:MAG: YIP1 family protein [Anaerolineae bacterium]|nr:YIP1 family protein [Anaerolineae bacterium]